MPTTNLLSSVSGVFSSPVIGTAMNIIIVMLFCGIVFICFLFVRALFKYNIKTTVFDFAGGQKSDDDEVDKDGLPIITTKHYSGRVIEDKGAVINKEDGIKELKLRKLGISLPMPPKRAFSFRKGLFGVGYALYLQRFSENDLRPLVFSENPNTFTPVSPNMQVWNVLAHRRNREKHQKPDFWAQYGHYIAWGATLAISCVVLLFLFREIKGLTGSISTLAGSVRDTMVTRPIGAP